MKGFIKKFYQRFICKHDYHLIGETTDVLNVEKLNLNTESKLK